MVAAESCDRALHVSVSRKHSGMPLESSPQRRRPWEEKNSLIAGVLAYLIPGAGHVYQGRWFKGIVYFVCILGTFFGGMKLGEGAVVYHLPNNRFGISLNYLAQVCVGMPALPAIYQAKRAKEASNQPVRELNAPLKAPFTGQLVTYGPGEETLVGELVGAVDLKTSFSGSFPETTGVFRGTLDGKETELQLSGGLMMERPISAGFQRPLECMVARKLDQHPHESQAIRGTIPRQLVDAYCAPPDPDKIKDLHGRLGKFYDLAIAFTMIAGLLNVLAVWDAVEGPAYGFGDEEAPDESSSREASNTAETPAKSEVKPLAAKA